MFGPLAPFELLKLGRRQRLHLWRALFTLALLAVVFVVYVSIFPLEEYPLFSLQTNSIPRNEVANFGSAFFVVFVVWQFIIIVLLTPTLAADAVAEEKERRTIDFLLITDLTNREIVLGKIAVRAAHLFMFLLAGMPVVAVLPLFGGVEPLLALACAVAGVCQLLGILAVSAFCSVHCRTARNAIGYTYAVLLVYALVISGASWAIMYKCDLEHWPSTDTWTSPVEVRDVLEVLSAGNPLSVALLAAERVQSGTPLFDVLPLYLGRFVAFNALVVIAFGLPAVRRLRTVAAVHAGGKVGRAAPGPEMPALPPITERPVLWRELYCEAFWPRTRRLKRTLYLLGLLGLLPILWMLAEWWTDPRHVDDIVNGLLRSVGGVVALGIGLGAANQAVRALGKERARLTYDSLVITDLRPREILVHKWLGAFLSNRLAFAWIVLVWAASVVVGALHPLAVPLLILATLVYGAFFVSLGLWCSVAATTTKAANQRFGGILFLIAIGVGLGALVLGLTERWRPPFFWSLTTAPPVALGVLAFRGRDVYARDWYDVSDVPVAIVAIVVNLGLYAFLAWRLWRAAVQRFEANQSPEPA